ncbi:unnamed protein product [Ostreobium quekettii]|uniref:Ubiquinone biosynthesis monooxygenase COQ6, mitochondrial n=1 Tax=Ostreobium quekettii TaxID=121088 RepID=A0A8S1JFC3_9CHLO|nr:unnamed protein product [Ostreobium quekettii]
MDRLLARRPARRGLMLAAEALRCRHRRLCASAASELYDVVIVGSGMVGAGLAAALGASPLTDRLRVAVLDQKTPEDKLASSLSPIPEMRVSTLTPASIQLLEKTGAWDRILPPSCASFSHMQVWDYSGAGCLRWSAADIQRDTMGAIIENGVLQSAFLAVARERAGVECIMPATVKALVQAPYAREPGSNSANPSSILRLEDGRLLRARLVVGADGAHSNIRQMSDIRTVGWEYDQRGLVATVRVSFPTDTAWQRFLPTGPVALLPVRAGFCNVVWSTTPPMARQLEKAPLDKVALAINEAFHGGPSNDPPSPVASMLEKAGQEPSMFCSPPAVVEIVGGPPRSFPLKLMHAGSYVRPRLALVGDAAHVVHPLAGQGVNLGLGDVQQLAEALAAAVETGQDIGDLHLLQTTYEQPRLKANLAMMAALDALKRAFGVQSELFAQMRNLGLDVLNAAKPIKNRVMQYAMGL